MAIRKSTRRLATAALLIGLVALGSALPALGNWQAFTSLSDARRMRLIDDTVYCATSGGLMLVADPATPPVVLDNLDGIGTTDLTDVTVDASGVRWITGHGRLVRLDSEGIRQFLFLDEEDNLIGLNCVVDDGDRLWVGTDIGLVYFSKANDGGQIQDSYGRFGDLPDFPAINAIALDGSRIWLGTSAGLATADRTSPVQLKSPASWTTWDAGFIGSGGMVERVAAFESDIYLTTAEGLFRLDTEPPDTTLAKLPLVNLPAVTELKVENDSLFYYCRVGLGTVINRSPVAVALPALPAGAIHKNGVRNGAYHWAVTTAGGYYDAAAGSFRQYPYSGLPGNDVVGVAVDGAGVVTAACSRRAVAATDSVYWETLDTAIGARMTLVAADFEGRAYVGTEGAGLWLYDGGMRTILDETNSTMYGNDDDLPNSIGYVYLKGVGFDDTYLYAACYRSYQGFPVAIADLSRLYERSGWDSLGYTDGFTDAFVTCLAARHRGIAVGTETQGLFVCAFGDDPFIHSHRECAQYTEDNSRLVSNTIRAVEYAPDGILWVGTNIGLTRLDPLEGFLDVTLPAGVARDVNDLAFDARANLWIATIDGLAFREASSGQFTVYTTLNSGLVDDAVVAVTVDGFTGDVYFSTARGISVLRSSSGPPAYSVEDVIAFPNPFVIRSEADRLRFNLARRGSVRIFTPAGEPVRDLDTADPWDGRNQSGERVASGVYLFVVTDEAGSSASGKILVVRE